MEGKSKRNGKREKSIGIKEQGQMSCSRKDKKVC